MKVLDILADRTHPGVALCGRDALAKRVADGAEESARARQLIERDQRLNLLPLRGGMLGEPAQLKIRERTGMLRRRGQGALFGPPDLRRALVLAPNPRPKLLPEHSVIGHRISCAKRIQ